MPGARRSAYPKISRVSRSCPFSTRSNGTSLHRSSNTLDCGGPASMVMPFDAFARAKAIASSRSILNVSGGSERNVLSSDSREVGYVIQTIPAATTRPRNMREEIRIFILEPSFDLSEPWTLRIRNLPPQPVDSSFRALPRLQNALVTKPRRSTQYPRAIPRPPTRAWRMQPATPSGGRPALRFGTPAAVHRAWRNPAVRQ